MEGTKTVEVEVSLQLSIQVHCCKDRAPWCLCPRLRASAWALLQRSPGRKLTPLLQARGTVWQQSGMLRAAHLLWQRYRNASRLLPRLTSIPLRTDLRCKL